MSKALCVSAGLDAVQAEIFESKLAGLSLTVDWKALYDFAMLALSKRGDLTISDIISGVMKIFGLTPPQVLGVAGPSFNPSALVKLLLDIQQGAPLAVILADILAVFGS